MPKNTTIENSSRNNLFAMINTWTSILNYTITTITCESITYKRGPSPSASSFRNSPSFSFNGDMRSISNLRHMMSGANPLAAFG
ncbi:hypothetical protein Smp_133260 [Schistosoma mansoni]|uniref:hypothetical protein n=1 Tax=Schistosoma mansoni TaxID=6183 RepID=UPI0001A645F7|nr:hypothetical protein Smp_133260 [Schistosoma mansoni]|eukprot:XP_018647936.1 hypothetical protein Smp_133260 [Schistosoma mansoni]